jgi:hypothetical protein
MKTFLVGTLLLAFTTGPAVLIGNNAAKSVPDYRHANAAFRDGLYLGKLDAAQNNDRHIAVGRWSTTEDRASFSEGYGLGYEQISAHRELNSSGAE